MLHCEYSLPRSRLYRAAFRIDSACSKSGERRHRRVLPCVNRLQEPARPMRHSRESGNLGRTDRRTPRLLLGGDPDWIPAYAGMTGGRLMSRLPYLIGSLNCLAPPCTGVVYG